MTGKYMYNLEKEGATIPKEHIIIGELLKSHGYETFHTGKWHNGKETFNRSFTSGKDIFFGGMEDHWNVPLFGYDISGEYNNSRRTIKNPWTENHTETLEGEYSYSGIHSTNIFTNSAIEFIEKQHSGDKPFFLSLCYMSPHDPRSMPDEFRAMYNIDDIELPTNYLKEHPFNNGELKVRDEVLASIPRIDDEIKIHILEYYAMISHMDSRIGDIIDVLKKNGVYDNTIIVFLADNGLAVGQHGLLGKQNLYEHSINVPLMIKPAQSKPIKDKSNHLCYLIDIYPTLCDLAGIDIPSSVDGVSLLPVLNNDKSVRDYLYYGYKNLQRAISDGEWKLIDYNVNGIKTSQLFNLKDDPMETNDLINDKRLSKKTKQLRNAMLEQKNKTGDYSKFWE